MQKEILLKYVEHLQKVMRIVDWDISLELKDKAKMCLDYGGGNYLGHCTRFRKYKSAIVSLNTELLITEDEIMQTLVHELFHVMTDDYISMVDNLCDADEASGETITGWYERLTNELTRMFIELYPLEKLKEDVENVK
jgi:hypothetical protein